MDARNGTFLRVFKQRRQVHRKMADDKELREAAKRWFESNGLSVADWAAHHGFKRDQVYSVLNGRSAAKRGEGHLIAVALGLKSPVTGTIKNLVDGIQAREEG